VTVRFAAVLRSVRRRTLTTPEIASEPYWAAAPSRSTSMFLTIAVGIVFRSTEAEPRPMVPLVDQRRRVAALRIDQHQGLVRRHAAQGGRADGVGAVGQAGRGKFSDGSAIDSAWLISVVPAFLQRFGRNDVDRRSGIEHGAVGYAGAGDDHGGAIVAAGAVWATPAPLANSEAMARARACFLGTNLFCIGYLPLLIMNWNPLCTRAFIAKTRSINTVTRVYESQFMETFQGFNN
jgi:hypothetical protein